MKIVDIIEQELKRTKPKSKFFKNGQLSRWSVFRIVAEYAKITYDKSDKTLFELQHLSNSNWWHNGSSMAVKRGEADDELQKFIYLCNQRLKDNHINYRIPLTIFDSEVNFASVAAVVDSIVDNKPKQGGVFISVLDETDEDYPLQHRSQSEAANHENCTTQLDNFLGLSGSPYAILSGHSDDSVNQFLFHYARRLNESLVFAKAINVIFYDTDKVKNVVEFVKGLVRVFINLKPELADIIDINNDKSQEQVNYLGHLEQALNSYEESFVLIVTGLNKGLMSSDLSQNLNRTLRNDDFCRLVTKLVGIKGVNDNKIVKVIFGVSEVLSSVRYEFERAKQIILYPPTQARLEGRLDEDLYKITYDVAKQSPRPVIKSAMIQLMVMLEDYFRDVGYLQSSEAETCSEELRAGIRNHVFGEKLCQQLFQCIKQRLAPDVLLAFKCICLCDDGLSYSSLAAVMNVIVGKALYKEEMMEAITVPLARLLTDYGEEYSQHNKVRTKQVFEVNASLRDYLLDFLQNNIEPYELHQIHHAIACRAIVVAEKYNANNRRIQALKHMLKLIDKEVLRDSHNAFKLALSRAIELFNSLNNQFKQREQFGFDRGMFNRQLAQCAWVYYFHCIEKQEEKQKEEGIYNAKLDRWEFSFDQFKQDKALTGTLLKGDILRRFCGLGLNHQVNHFYLPEVLRKSLTKRQLLDFLAAYCVNAYNRVDYNDLAQCVATYHQIFRQYTHETPAIAIELAVYRSSIHLFARESMSRITICHIRKLFDQGYTIRVVKLCQEHIEDLNQLIEHSLKNYFEARKAVQSHVEKGIAQEEIKWLWEEKSSAKLLEFIRKLLKRRVRYESVLLKVHTHSARWDEATKHCINVYQMTKDALLHLYHTGQIGLNISSAKSTELEHVNPKYKDNRPLIHSIEYFVNFRLFEFAEFGSRLSSKGGALVDEGFKDRVITQGMALYFQQLTSDNRDETKTFSEKNALWITVVREVKKTFADQRLRQQHNVSTSLKFDDMSSLKILKEQFQFANDNQQNAMWPAFNGAKKHHIDTDLDPMNENLSQQVKLQLEVELFKVIAGNCQSETDMPVIESHIRTVKQTLKLLREMKLVLWHVDSLIVYAALINRWLDLYQLKYPSNIKLNEELSSKRDKYRSEKDKALISANQLIEKSQYYYREVDWMIQQYPDKPHSRPPIFVR